MTVIANNKRGRNGFENKIIAVITIINPILTKMALNLRLLLPGMSPGAFKKVPTTIAVAYSKYPKKYSRARGTAIPNPIRIPRSKLELFRNNSSCLSFSFKQLSFLILKIE